jgi:hypothetical protein
MLTSRGVTLQAFPEPCHKPFLTGHMKAYACSFSAITPLLACMTGILLSVRNGTAKRFQQQWGLYLIAVVARFCTACTSAFSDCITTASCA